MKTKEQSYAMGIDELSQKSGFIKESIYRFTRMGLLPRPSKIGFQKSLYNEEHLNRLRKIRELHEKEQMSFSKIKKILPTIEDVVNIQQLYSSTKKEQIMDKALEMFSRNGFTNTKVSEITDELGVAKGTFYLYFNSKKDLFVECISRLTKIVLPEEVIAQIKKEDDFFKRQRIKLDAFLRVFPSYSGVLNLLKLSIQSNDTTVANKAKETYKLLAEPVTTDLRKAVRAGFVRNVNADMVGLLLLGMAESVGYMAMIDSTWTSKEGAEVLADVMANGLLKREAANTKPKKSWHVKDQAGSTIALDNLRFDNNDFLPAALGEGQLNVTLENVKSVGVEENNKLYFATITHSDGDKLTLSINGDLLVSGNSKLGTYRAPIRKISEIVASF